MTESPPAGVMRVSDEVLIATEEITFLSADHIAYLKRMALQSDKKRARICLHRAPEDPVHEMVIAVHKTSFIEPHSHPHKEESLLIIEGSCDVAVFSNNGHVERLVSLGRGLKETRYFYRIAKNLIHGLLLHSEWIVFHEVAEGPLRSDGNLVPSWVPNFTDAEEGNLWLSEYVNEPGR